MSTPNVGGASISARARTPSLDLASLSGLLVASIPAKDEVAKAEGFSLLRFDSEAHRLHVNLRGVLQRLYGQPGKKSVMSAGEANGFLRDIEFPPKYCIAKLGGRLLPGSEASTTSEIKKLQDAINEELDKACSDADIRALVSPDIQTLRGSLAKRLQVNVPNPPSSAHLTSIGFASPDRKVAEREKDMARVLTAIETIEGRDWLEKMLSGVHRKFVSEDIPDEEINGIIDTLRSQRNQPGSQIRRFLEFLDDEALARVRLQVTFKLMDAVATQSHLPGLKAYVERVNACFNLFGGADGQALPLDVSSVYGQRNCSDLSDHLRKALFYGALPVWPEWSVQLFEARVEPENGFATKREVSYRFRINGQNPESGKSAFASRIDRLEERLLSEPGPNVSGQKGIAELVFLRLVVPDSMDAPTPEHLLEKAQAIAQALQKNPAGAVRKLVDTLRQRESVMDHLAQELVRVLQSKSAKLVDTANRTADKFYVSVHKNIIDWNAALAMSSNSTEVLATNEQGHENIAWFERLTITDDPASVPGALASYWVETNLVERSIVPTGDASEVPMSRNLEQPALLVRLVPFNYERTDGSWLPADTSSMAFDAGPGIDLEYDIKALAISQSSKMDKADLEQIRTSNCAAASLISYLVMWEIARRLKRMEGMQDLAMLMLRLQPGDRQVKSSDGNAAVYAFAHAIEYALSRELLVKMQGYHTGGSMDTASYRKRGTVAAVEGGFPLRTTMSGTLEKVALISYVTRPSDTHPMYPDADGFLFVSRTYCADRKGTETQVRQDSMQSRLVETRSAFREPQLILEEIARLRAAGYSHIVLLSHHFGNRHIGRAAERHSPHGTFEFLEEASKRYPDVYLYPLRRDVFPATRLHKRRNTESGFEVLSFADHQAMYDSQVKDLLRSLMPVYTFATLAVVAEKGRPQSGFCTYFFDSDQRLTNLEWAETIRQNILGIGAGKGVRDSITGMLRTLHYLESEKPATKEQLLPVLDPFDWASPTTTGSAGELEVLTRRGKGSVLLSFSALLAHVTKVLHREADHE